jgi:hypothetical protein
VSLKGLSLKVRCWRMLSEIHHSCLVRLSPTPCLAGRIHKLEAFGNLCSSRVHVGIAKNTEQIFSRNGGCFAAQIIKFSKKVKHAVFVHNMIPVLRLDVGEHSWAKTRVERNNLFKLSKTGPFEVLCPSRISPVEFCSCNKPGNHRCLGSRRPEIVSRKRQVLISQEIGKVRASTQVSGDGGANQACRPSSTDSSA